MLWRLDSPIGYSKTRSCPKEFPRHCTLCEQNFRGSVFPVSDVERNAHTLSEIWTASTVSFDCFGSHDMLSLLDRMNLISSPGLLRDSGLQLLLSAALQILSRSFFMVNILYHGISYGNISLEYYHPSIHRQDLKLHGWYCCICAAWRCVFHECALLRAVRSPVSSVQWMRHFRVESLTIIPEAQMGSESIAHEFSKIQLVGQKYQDKTTLASKTRFSNHCFGFQRQCFSLLVGYNI